LVVGVFVAGNNANGFDDLINPSYSYVWGLLTLALWTTAPIKIRPLTTPGVTLQQRYAVVALILGAGLAWLVWLGETLNGESWKNPSGLGILTTVGLLAAAVFLRLGWKKGTQP